MNSTFKFGADRMTFEMAVEMSKGNVKGILCDEVIERIEQSRSHVDEIVASELVVYGINTGFGPLVDTRISKSETARLQHNILMSHAVGVGNLISPQLSKIMLILKAHALSLGFSGVRLQTVRRIIWMIDSEIIPCVPEKGSVGASGDLAPLSHLFLPLIGMGEVHCNGEIRKTQEVLEEMGVQPLILGPKEGLALINGTQFIAAHAVWALHRMRNILDIADIAGALSLEGLMGSAKPFDSRLHDIRPFSGNKMVASRLCALLENSEIRHAHADCGRIQDPYSLRCMPQVHGASRNAWLHLEELVEIEINSVTDNPVILGSRETISGGNFHGQPLAIPLDYATVAAAEIGNISERRSYLIIEGRFGLPKLLIENAGLNSGFMIPQYSAAALVTENKTLCFPASADSIPTSLGQEDHVSMGSISGRKLHQVLNNVEYILAIELLYAAQAVDFRRPLQSTPIMEKVHALIRENVSFATEDRIFSEDINRLHRLISDEILINAVRDHAKVNNIEVLQ